VAYIDGTFLDNTFGSANVTALCPTTTERDAVITMAEAQVYSALWNAGYQTDSAPGDLTPSTTPDVVQLATFGAWLEIAHLRNRKELPEEAERYTGKVDAIESGQLEIPSLSKTVTRAVGGVTKPDTSSSRADDGRPAVFSGDKMDGWF